MRTTVLLLLIILSSHAFPMPNVKLTNLLNQAVALQERAPSEPLSALIAQVAGNLYSNDPNQVAQLEQQFYDIERLIPTTKTWNEIVAMGEQVVAAAATQDPAQLERLLQQYWYERSKFTPEMTQVDYKVQQVNEQLQQLQQVRDQMEASILGTTDEAYYEELNDNQSQLDENTARLNEIDSELAAIQQQRQAMEAQLNRNRPTYDPYVDVGVQDENINPLNKELQEMQKARQVLQSQMVTNSPDQVPPLFSSFRPPLFLNPFRRRVDPSLKREPESFKYMRSKSMTNQPLTTKVAEGITRGAKQIFESPSFEAPSMEFWDDAIESGQQESGIKTTILQNLEFVKEDIDRVTYLASSFTKESVKVARGAVETAEQIMTTGRKAATSTASLLDALKRESGKQTVENPEDAVGELPSINELYSGEAPPISSQDARYDESRTEERLPSKTLRRPSPRSKTISWEDLANEWAERNRDQDGSQDPSRNVSFDSYSSAGRSSDSIAPASEEYQPGVDGFQTEQDPDNWRQSAAHVSSYLESLRRTWDERESQLQSMLIKETANVEESGLSDWEKLAEEWKQRNS